MPEPNGPAIVHELPGYLDGPLSERARLRAEMDQLKARLAKIQLRYSRLEEVIMWALFDSGIRRCFDPFTRLSIKVNTSGNNLDDRPISITDEDCGLSTQVMLTGEQRAKLAEILGIEEEGPKSGRTEEQIAALRRAHPDCNPHPIGRPDLAAKAKPAQPATDGRRDEGPAIEGEAEAEGSSDSLIATREAIRRAGGSDWDEVGDPEAFLDRKPGDRPRPVVAPAYGGSKVKLVESQDPEPSYRGVSMP